MPDKRDLTHGSVRYQLIRLAGPLVFGIIALISVGIVDAYFLGQLGTEPLAAISFAFPVSFAITSLAIGLSAGTGSVLSRSIGRKDRSRTKRLATDSLVLALLLSVVVAVIGYLTIRPLFSLVGAEGRILDLIEAYMAIWYLSFPLLVLAQVANNILRANGDALVPSGLMIGSAIVTILLDPLFIFGGFGIPGMGIEGAAWALVAGRIFIPLVAIPVLIFRDRILDFILPNLTDMLDSWREILRIGLPAALGNAVNPIGISIVTAMLAVYGAETVAGFGVATRLESFASIPMLALSGSIGPLVGQNWGAGKFDRVREAIRFAMLICFVWGVATAAIFAFAAGPLSAQFSDSATVTEEARLYLWIVPVTLAGYGVTIVAAGAFNALGRPILGLGLYLIRTAALYVPLASIATLLFATTGVYAAIAVTNVLAGIAVYFATFRWLDRMIERERVIA